MKINFLIFFLLSFICFSFSLNIDLQDTNNNVCDSCITNLSDILLFIGNNSTMSQVEQALDLLCFLLPRGDRDACRNIINSVIHSLESLDKSIIEDYSPQQFCSILGFCETYCCATPYYPQEVHISLSSNETKMNIMWVTQLLGNTPTVRYGLSPNSLSMSTIGTSHTYTQGGWNGYIYLVELENLQPSTTYYYQVGDPDWKFMDSYYTFDTAPSTPVSSSDFYTFITYGDMGSSNQMDPNLYWLYQASLMHSVDIILHIGDISYADGYQPGWDLFLQKIEPVAAQIPYMTTVGNHEEFFDFTAYRNRFQMPVDNLNNVNRFNMSLYYSFNYGNTHIIAISAEELWGLAPDLHKGKAQYEWLLSDLQSVNRDEFPWIVAFLHRPLYCTTDDTKRCIVQSQYYRNLIEDLFYDYKVDLVLTAHLHNYERTLPVYNSTIIGNFNQNTQVFNSPQAPIYSVIGTGGDHEGLRRSYMNPSPDWSVESSHIAEWGYTMFTSNATYLNWEFHNAQTGEIQDQFIITK